MSSSTNTHIAQFSTEGLDLGNSHRTMTYLHGLSDFWATTFADTETVNLLMEANAVTASETYSKFLQLTSGISLEDLSHLTNSQIKLIFVSVGAKVSGTVETYKLTDKIASARFISNRPFLPTSTLEQDVDFHIDEADGTISFAKHIGEYLFPFRTGSDGSREYSMWVVDARVDSDLIYKNYASLLGITKPERTSENFKNFVYGLYYLYMQGPSVDLLRRGLNLALGVPLIRDSETVLEIRKYLNTDQYIVISDINSYVVPYGLAPTCVVGDVLVTGDEIASWVEVKDYVNDGDWWINYMIPSDLLPHVPTDIAGRNRYATTGSYADYLMRNYLKTHTFLVNVKTVGFKNIQTFQELSAIIKRVKPSYTTPIYVWTVPVGNEDIELKDDPLYLSKYVERCAGFTSGMYRFVRSSTNPLTRTCPQFTRFSVPAVLKEHTGNAEEINGYARSFMQGTVTGYVYPQKQFRTMSSSEDAWMRALAVRNAGHRRGQRSQVGFNRGITQTIDGTGSDPIAGLFPEHRLICLYTTIMTDVLDKFQFANETPESDKYVFTLFQPMYQIDGINEVAINDSIVVGFYDFIMANFDKYFKRDPSVSYLGPFCAKDNYRVFTPAPGDINQNDFLVFVKIVDYTVGVFWATQNQEVAPVPYWDNDGDDILTMSIPGKLYRGMGPLGNPAYVLRGDGLDLGGGVTQVGYSDADNTPMVLDRSGKVLTTRKIMR